MDFDAIELELMNKNRFIVFVLIQSSQPFQLTKDLSSNTIYALNIKKEHKSFLYHERKEILNFHI